MSAGGRGGTTCGRVAVKENQGIPKEKRLEFLVFLWPIRGFSMGYGGKNKKVWTCGDSRLKLYGEPPRTNLLAVSHLLVLPRPHGFRPLGWHSDDSDRVAHISGLEKQLFGILRHRPSHRRRLPSQEGRLAIGGCRLNGRFDRIEPAPVVLRKAGDAGTFFGFLASLLQTSTKSDQLVAERRQA